MTTPIVTSSETWVVDDIEAVSAPGVRLDPSEAYGRVERRHGEGGDWLLVDMVYRAGELADIIASPSFRVDYGDLLRATNSLGEVVGFWIQTRVGLTDAGDVPAELGCHGKDWEAAWDGPDADGTAMPCAAEGSDRRRLVQVACDCAETLLECVPTDEVRPRRAIEAARRYVRGEGTLESLRAAADAATAVGDDCEIDADHPAAYAAAWAAGFAARAACEASRSDDLGHLATRVATQDTALTVAAGVFEMVEWSHRSEGDANRALAPIVRKRLPLSMVLLGRAGQEISAMRRSSRSGVGGELLGS